MAGHFIGVGAACLWLIPGRWFKFCFLIALWFWNVSWSQITFSAYSPADPRYEFEWWNLNIGMGQVCFDIARTQGSESGLMFLPFMMSTRVPDGMQWRSWLLPADAADRVRAGQFRWGFVTTPIPDSASLPVDLFPSKSWRFSHTPANHTTGFDTHLRFPAWGPLALVTVVATWTVVTL